MKKSHKSKLEHYREKTNIDWDNERATDNTLTDIAKLLADDYAVDFQYIWAKERSGSHIQINAQRVVKIANSQTGAAFLQNEGFLICVPDVAKGENVKRYEESDMYLLPVSDMHWVVLSKEDKKMVTMARYSHTKKDQPQNQTTFL